MKLREFLVKAKLNTYAAGQDSNREFIYEDGDLRYQDKYFGYNPFAGQEIVYKKDNPFWVMNYYGVIFGSEIDSKLVYKFLRLALRQVDSQKPFRGPREFSNEDYSYSNQSDGTIHAFRGTESIFYKGQEVYTLIYHGGAVVPSDKWKGID